MSFKLQWERKLMSKRKSREKTEKNGVLESCKATFELVQVGRGLFFHNVNGKFARDSNETRPISAQH